jgi:C4-dicarboxylate transporter, DctQ subunit
MRALGILARWIARIEDALLASLGLALLAAAAAQLVFRLIGAGPVWLDPAMRLATLWLALIGALVATRESRQLRIDVFAERLRGALGWAARGVVATFTAVICVTLAMASWTLVELERETGTEFFTGIPTWWTLAILPPVFAMMAVHALGELASRRHPQLEPES